MCVEREGEREGEIREGEYQAEACEGEDWKGDMVAKVVFGEC